MQPAPAGDDAVIAATRLWLERAVIGLNLCPFAKSVHVKGQVRFVVSPATGAAALLEDLGRELLHLQDSDPEQLDTTLLIHPHALQDFSDYLWFIDLADGVLEQLRLVGELQVAQFHPQFQFEGTSPDAISNYTNRSPYPILHLLREDSIDRAVAAFPDASVIYQRNIETLEDLGLARWKALLGLLDETP
ncbi:MAG: DUF1415 domain-containing protein [Pseudomonadota bacterium]|nr:DUF1415 domain-containing protein [Pseudomonadota bacterium]